MQLRSFSRLCVTQCSTENRVSYYAIVRTRKVPKIQNRCGCVVVWYDLDLKDESSRLNE